MDVAIPMSDPSIPGREEETGIVFKLTPKLLDTQRSDSTKIQRTTTEKKVKLNIPLKSNFAQNVSQNKKKLINQVSLDMEIEVGPYKDTSGGASPTECASPTKGAPIFFKNLIRDVPIPTNRNTRDISSPSNKLKLEWKQVLKKIGSSFLKSIAENESSQKQKNISKFQKEHEDVVKRVDDDFD